MKMAILYRVVCAIRGFCVLQIFFFFMREKTCIPIPPIENQKTLYIGNQFIFFYFPQEKYVALNKRINNGLHVKLEYLFSLLRNPFVAQAHQKRGNILLRERGCDTGNSIRSTLKNPTQLSSLARERISFIFLQCRSCRRLFPSKSEGYDRDGLVVP